MPPDILDNLTHAGRPVPAPNATTDMPVLDITTQAEPAPEPPVVPVGPAPEPAPVLEPAPEPDPNPDARTRRELRFADLTRQIAAERERASRAVEATAALTEQTRALMAKLEQLTTPPAPPSLAEAPRPTRDRFDSPEDYDAAMIEWATERGVSKATQEWERRRAEEVAAEERKRNEEAHTQAQRQQIESWQTRRAAALEKYPDFAEIAEADGVTISSDMANAMMAIDEGPEVAYHLGKNPAEAAAIAKLAPVQQIAAIGRLSARLNAPPPPVTPPATPPPINPLRTGNGATELSPDEDPNYMEKRLLQLRSQRAPGNIGMARN